MFDHGTSHESHFNTPCSCLKCQGFQRRKSTKRTPHLEGCNCLSCQNAQTVISEKNALTILSKKAAPRKQVVYDVVIHEVIQTIDSNTGKRSAYNQSRTLVYLP